MTEWWREFDRAVHRRDWRRARRLASLLAAEWGAVRGFLEVVAGPGASAPIRELEALIVRLRDALESPVNVAEVEAVAFGLRKGLP